MEKPITGLVEAVEYIRSPEASGPLPLRGDIHPDDWRLICDNLRRGREASMVLADHLAETQNRMDAADIRRIQAERRNEELEQRLANVAPPADIPRTITLTYTPRVNRPECAHPDEYFDEGGYWCVIEGAGMQEMLDAQEAMVLVSAMLLGAKHPPLKSMAWAHAQMRRARLKQNTNTVERLPVRIEAPGVRPWAVYDIPLDKLVETILVNGGTDSLWAPVASSHWAQLGYDEHDCSLIADRAALEAQRRNDVLPPTGMIAEDDLVESIPMRPGYKPHVWVPRAWSYWTQRGFDVEQIKEIMQRAEVVAAYRNTGSERST